MRAVTLTLALLFSSAWAIAQEAPRLSAGSQAYVAAFNSGDIAELYKALRAHTDPSTMPDGGVRGWAFAHAELMRDRGPVEEPIPLSASPAREEFLTRSTRDGHWYRWVVSFDEGKLANSFMRRSFPPQTWDASALPRESLNAFVGELRSQLGTPALAIAVGDGDGDPAVGVAGVRRLGADGNAAPNDRFHTGSCTKAMTATIVASLVEEGQLGWATTLAELFDPDDVHADLRGVTIDDLLRHRAGFGANWHTDAGYPSFADLEARYAGWAGTRIELHADIAREMLTHPPAHTPGRTHYSNVGYTVLAHIIERVSGRAWEDLLRERVFEPAGMTTAGLGWPAAADRDTQPWGHRVLEGWELAPEAPEDYPSPYAAAPAGDVHCSIGDLARFLDFHARGLRGEIDALGRDAFVRLHSPEPGDPESLGYAAGWQVESQGGVRVHSHTGSANRFYTEMILIPDRNVVIALAMNTQLPASEWLALIERVIPHAVDAAGF